MCETNSMILKRSKRKEFHRNVWTLVYEHCEHTGGMVMLLDRARPVVRSLSPTYAPCTNFLTNLVLFPSAKPGLFRSFCFTNCGATTRWPGASGGSRSSGSSVPGTRLRSTQVADAVGNSAHSHASRLLAIRLTPVNIPRLDSGPVWSVKGCPYTNDPCPLCRERAIIERRHKQPVRKGLSRVSNH